MSFLRSKTFFYTTSLGLFTLFTTISPDFAHAASASGESMPYDTALQTIHRSLTGTVAQIIVICAIVGSIVGYILANEDFKELTKKFLTIAIAGGVIMFADRFVERLFSGGAIVPISQEQQTSLPNTSALGHSINSNMSAKRS